MQLTGSSVIPIDQLHLVKSLQIALNKVFILRFVCHNVNPIVALLQLIFSYIVEFQCGRAQKENEGRKEGKENKKRN